MSIRASSLPARRTDLVLRAIDDNGQYVVKDPRSQQFFHLGEQEHFLLMQLDEENDAKAVCSAFRQRFGEPLSMEDLTDFVETAWEQRLLDDAEWRVENAEPNAGEGPASNAHSALRAPRSKQSILYWRKKLFDPDRLFNWLEPKIRSFWTRGFLIFSAVCILLAVVVLWTSRGQLASSFANALRWETLLLVWLTMFLIGILHEFAHGLTCKHYGGEVREIGFLSMYFMPCYYCNVSDAWLFRERSKRLWVTFAGGYFELFLWALAVFVWRVTMPDTLINYLAFILVAACGIDSLFNFNPLIKLDGYYLLSDWVEVPNLRQRSLDHLMGHLRRLLWGGPWPDSVPRGRFLLGYGLASWLFSLFFVVMMLVFMLAWMREYLGTPSLAVVGVLGLVSARGLLGDVFRVEFTTMIWKRHKRKIAWLAVMMAVVVASLLIPWRDNASGDFQVRAVTHAELRAPVAGFLQQVHYDEGQKVYENGVVAQLVIPDLASRIARKDAELREAQAKLELLRAGAGKEEIARQRRRVQAAQAWRDVAARDLKRQEQALEQELIRFEKISEEYQAECEYAKQALGRLEDLRRKNAVSEDDYLQARRAYLVSSAKCEQTMAEKQSRAVRATSVAESVLAECDKELAGELATLALLEAGTRPEEIEAAQATVARLGEELSYLHQTKSRLTIQSPVAGKITTCRLKEKIGDYFEEGELVCEVEDACSLEVVIALDEDQAARVQLGQKVRLKARSQAFDVFHVKVDRIAPCAEAGEEQSKINVYCRLDDPKGKLRSGMTGYARIQCDRKSIALVCIQNCLRYVRTEFWW